MMMALHAKIGVGFWWVPTHKDLNFLFIQTHMLQQPRRGFFLKMMKLTMNSFVVIVVEKPSKQCAHTHTRQ